MSYRQGIATCDWSTDCNAPVSHLDEKGFVYCTEHGIGRRLYSGRRCRKLRPWELKMVHAGKALPSYTPQPKPKTEAAP